MHIDKGLFERDMTSPNVRTVASAHSLVPQTCLRVARLCWLSEQMVIHRKAFEVPNTKGAVHSIHFPMHCWPLHFVCYQLPQPPARKSTSVTRHTAQCNSPLLITSGETIGMTQWKLCNETNSKRFICFSDVKRPVKERVLATGRQIGKLWRPVFRSLLEDPVYMSN